MSQSDNPFAPGYQAPGFGIPGTPGDGSPGMMQPVLLGGIGGAAPVYNTTPQNISDFYGGITTIGQPDVAYFDEFPLPGDNRAAANSGLDVADQVDVVDTRIDYTDPSIYADILDQLKGILNTGGADAESINEAMNDVVSGGVSMQGTAGGLTGLSNANGSDVPPIDPSIGGFTTAYDGSDIMNQLSDLRAMQDMFITANDIPEPVVQYDDTVLKNQMLDLEDRMANFEIPNQTFQQFDPSGLQSQIDELAMAQPVDTSQFLTAADLPAAQPFDPSGLQAQIDDLRNLYAGNTGGFASPTANFRTR